MSDCIFCKIITGEIPSTKLYEDDFVIAFKDLYPQAPIHFLVVPKIHIPCALDITGENSVYVAKCFEVIAKLTKDFETGFRVINNCGEDAGQSVKHLHFHVLAGRKLGEKLCAEN